MSLLWKKQTPEAFLTGGHEVLLSQTFPKKCWLFDKQDTACRGGV